MKTIAKNALGALSSRFGSRMEQTSGMTLDQLQTAVQNGDEKSLCWLKKAAMDAAERLQKENPQQFAMIARITGGRIPFFGSR
jgi:hypothetical protein